MCADRSFWTKKNYRELDEQLADYIQRCYKKLANGSELTDQAMQRFRWSAASDGLQQLILRYTAGRPVEDLRAQLPQVVEDFDVYIANEVSPRKKRPST